MRNKLKISAVLLALLLSVTLITVTGANAITFDMRIPSFGLYCKNQNADVHGKVKYVIDGNGKAVQYSEYSVNGTDELNFEIPFVSTVCELPRIDISVNGKAVTGEICYGERYYSGCDLRFYSSDIDDNLMGTLYTFKTDDKSFTVDFEPYGKQNYIYLFTNSIKLNKSNGKYSYELDNAHSEINYHIFVINGEFAEIESSVQTEKETLSVKEYISRYFADVEYYYYDESVTPDLLYALINRAMENNIDYNFSDFFFNSFSELRLNAYKVDLKTDKENNTVVYSLPVDVQTNNNFNPAIFMTEQTATGNYKTDYTVELNGELPYIIESGTNFENRGDYIYTAQNVSGDFYFVFSSSKQPEDAYKNTENDTFGIAVLYVIIGTAVCAFAATILFVIIHYGIKRKR